MSAPPLPTLTLNDALRHAYSKLLALESCNVKASATQTCAAQFIDTACNAEALCCNSNLLEVLDCSDGVQVTAALVDTVTAATSSDPALQQYVENVLRAGNNWTPADSLQQNLAGFFSSACNSFSTINQQLFGRFLLNRCDDVLITMFNRSSGRVQCGLTALGSLFPPPPPIPVLVDNKAGLSTASINWSTGIGAVGVLALIACIVLGVIWHRQRHAAPLQLRS